MSTARYVELAEIDSSIALAGGAAHALVAAEVCLQSDTLGPKPYDLVRFQAVHVCKLGLDERSSRLLPPS